MVGLIEGAGADESTVEPIDPSIHSPSIADGSMVGTHTVNRR